MEIKLDDLSGPERINSGTVSEFPGLAASSGGHVHDTTGNCEHHPVLHCAKRAESIFVFIATGSGLRSAFKDLARMSSSAS
jgi:hypothetical protein